MKVLLLSGGTGGHIYPSIALGHELIARGATVRVGGRPDSLEQTLAGRAGLPFVTVRASGFAATSLGARLRFFVNLARGLADSRRVLGDFDPDALVACGSYAALAPVLVGACSRRPIFLLEQNRIAGRATRFLARWAREVYVTFPVTSRLAAPVVETGTPLRREILALTPTPDNRTVLVLGGSQGARRLNDAALALARTRPDWRVTVLCGTRDYERLRAQPPAPNCRLVAFTDHPEELYRDATVVVSRAGALTVSELLVLGLPAVLVPFPFAADDHQRANARYLAEQGAARVLDEAELDRLPALATELMADPAARSALSQRARALARPDAAARIAERITACSAA